MYRFVLALLGFLHGNDCSGAGVRMKFAFRYAGLSLSRDFENGFAGRFSTSPSSILLCSNRRHGGYRSDITVILKKPCRSFPRQE
ncbi:hypothetical protein BN77_3903 [Rhizobium mesoamericanum STM3625]|uniref:Uncharacterized protein n=1 Tax=Rhizobium mesoamericanum STM3625 TaxID=1211777 RepID=K0Q2S6_9HYPH|nr:hypothetical protein BN77_3903 [Rhizobium mesoamericanum STM3625]